MPAGIYVRTLEIRAKNRLAHIGKPESAETREKISIMLKKRYEFPEARERLRLAIKEHSYQAKQA